MTSLENMLESEVDRVRKMTAARIKGAEDSFQAMSSGLTTKLKVLEEKVDALQSVTRASDTSQQLPGPSESPSALPTGPSATSARLPSRPGTPLPPASRPGTPLPPASRPGTPLPPATSREEPEVHRCCTISGKHPQPRSTPSAEQRELSAPSPSQLEVIYVPGSPPPSDLPEQLAIPCSPPPLTSTPLSSKSQGVKRKAATGLEELDQDLAQDLQSYMPAHHSSRDKLSRLQLAFFEMQMDKLQIKGMFQATNVYLLQIVNVVFKSVLLSLIEKKNNSSNKKKTHGHLMNVLLCSVWFSCDYSITVGKI
ncbi:hypothetical protein AMEX_G28080 [Astyanax mexicanus]|uniref:Uncharacterized protein n=1 Tax=Astyanax mexicanus TaxID=7994 RepID=A0A8T2KNT9_ASTMX|nr:hypothetical protein AMEX_G28080 [Astyanax mexicanus]